jgi:hypothetical protein
VVVVGETLMLGPEPTGFPAKVYHWTLTGAVPVTTIVSVELPPDGIDPGLLVGCVIIAAGVYATAERVVEPVWPIVSLTVSVTM